MAAGLGWESLRRVPGTAWSSRGTGGSSCNNCSGPTSITLANGGKKRARAWGLDGEQRGGEESKVSTGQTLARRRPSLPPGQGVRPYQVLPNCATGQQMRIRSGSLHTGGSLRTPTMFSIPKNLSLPSGRGGPPPISVCRAGGCESAFCFGGAVTAFWSAPCKATSVSHQRQARDDCAGPHCGRRIPNRARPERGGGGGPLTERFPVHGRDFMVLNMAFQPLRW